jgi:thiamine pyrophosphokinase
VLHFCVLSSLFLLLLLLFAAAISMTFLTGNGALVKLLKGGLDDDDEGMLLIAAQAKLKLNKQHRNFKWFYNQLNWDGYIEMLRHTGGFQTWYHMIEDS